MKKNGLVILGATGSIGENACRVAARFPERFEVVGLVARNNLTRLAEKAMKLRARTVITTDEQQQPLLRQLLPASVAVHGGDQAVIDLVTRPEVDVVLCAIVGTGGLPAVLAAIRAGKRIALASKEVLVMAGELVRRELAAHPQAELVPVDSEHSAIFQCLAGRRPEEVANLVLTASGGAFRNAGPEEIARATCHDALRHPTWSMGPKVTIDSASLMNKALELLEARYLFQVEPDRLKVVIHPESVVHSMVELTDGSLIAQLAMPDMRFAIQYALSYPERWDGGLPRLDFRQLAALHFTEPDRTKYPSLDFADTAMRTGGTLPAVMNAANEVAVEKFRSGQIVFPKIWSIIEKTMAAHTASPQEDLTQILTADREARLYAAALE